MKKHNFLGKLKEKRRLIGLNLEKIRFKVPVKLWWVGVFLLTGALVASGGWLLWGYTASAEETVENTSYYCLQEAAFDYRVHLVPNEFFTGNVLPSGRAYMRTLTDYIAVDLNYLFAGEGEVQLSGDYRVEAKLAAYTSDEEFLVWEKDYELLPKEEFNTVGSNYSISKQIMVPFAQYLEFTEQIREETGYNPAELNLLISADINTKAETSGGVITERFSPNMVIPMKDNAFSIAGNLEEQAEGGITETHTVEAVPVENARAFAPVAVAFSALALVIFRFLTVPAKKNKREKRLEVPAILKKHKERIVITANGVTTTPPGAITVCSFDELLKLADEMNKPILYPQPGVAEGSEHIFLIFTPEQVYAYGVKEEQVSNVEEV